MRAIALTVLVACAGSATPATPHATAPASATSTSMTAATASAIVAPLDASADTAEREPTTDYSDGPFRRAAFSADGTRIALAGHDLVVIDVATRRRLHAADIGGVTDIRFAPDGKLAALGRSGLSIFVEGHRDAVASVPRSKIAYQGGGVFWAADSARLFADGTVRDASLASQASISYERREPGFKPESWLVGDGVFSGDTIRGWRTENGHATLGSWPAAGGAMRPLGLTVATARLNVEIVDAQDELLLSHVDEIAFALTRGSRLVRIVHGDWVAFAGKDRVAVLINGDVEISPIDKDAPVTIKGPCDAFAISRDAKTIALWSWRNKLELRPLP